MKNIFKTTRVGVFVSIILSMLCILFVSACYISWTTQTIMWYFQSDESYINAGIVPPTFSTSLIISLIYSSICLVSLIMHTYVIVKEIKWANRCFKTIKKSKAYNNNKKVRS